MLSTNFDFQTKEQGIGAVISRQGGQDRIYLEDAPNDIFVGGVFDGHGFLGEKVAEYTIDLLKNTVKKDGPWYEYDRYENGGKPADSVKLFAKEVIDKVFNADYTEVLREDSDSEAGLESGGTTATIMIAQKKSSIANPRHREIDWEGLILNVGDTPAYKIQSDDAISRLYVPHSVVNNREVSRMQEAGAKIKRKYFRSGLGVIQLSRALGDLNNINGFIAPDVPGLITKPSVSSFTLKRDEAVLIGSDGVFQGPERWTGWTGQQDLVEEREFDEVKLVANSILESVKGVHFLDHLEIDQTAEMLVKMSGLLGELNHGDDQSLLLFRA